MVFWWTGRGYLALLTVIGVYGLFGAIVTFAIGDTAFERLPWLWGIGALLSAISTWYLGCRINKKPITLPRLSAFRKRLFYKPRNRFMALPLETWAVPMLFLSVYEIVHGVVSHA